MSPYLATIYLFLIVFPAKREPEEPGHNGRSWTPAFEVVIHYLPFVANHAIPAQAGTHRSTST